MTAFSPLPDDPTPLLSHLGEAALARHAATALRLLKDRGVDLPPVLIDEVDEVETECVHRRSPPAGLSEDPRSELASLSEDQRTPSAIETADTVATRVQYGLRRRFGAPNLTIVR